MGRSKRTAVAIRAGRFFGAAFAVAVLFAGPASATDLVPQTKLRVSVVQWMPTQGQYQKWDALGGEFEVGDDGTILLPIIGTVSVAHKSVGALADEIAKRVKDKIGLVSAPSTMVQVLDYPPVYVVGDVSAPGEYKFREGMTVLQALAMSGGAYRLGSATDSTAVLSTVSELRGTDESILRTTARIARLQAEFAGAETISFPALPADPIERARATTVYDQEKTIFQARRNALVRQTKSLEDLQALLTREIETLQQKIKMSDAAIASVEKELNGVKILVQKGFSIAQRQTDLELQLARFQADRLDNLTAQMRGRQSMTEATRNLQALQDDRQTDIAAELQQQQANLEQLRLKRDTTQKVLLKQISSETDIASQDSDNALKFTLIRKEDGRPENTAADQSTTLLPGDVLKVDNPVLPAGAVRQPNAKDDGKTPPATRSPRPVGPHVSSLAERGS